MKKKDKSTLVLVNLNIAAKTAKKAFKDNISLKEACVEFWENIKSLCESARTSSTHIKGKILSEICTLTEEYFKRNNVKLS